MLQENATATFFQKIRNMFFKINAQHWLNYTYIAKNGGVCIMRLMRKNIIEVPDDISAVRLIDDDWESTCSICPACNGGKRGEKDCDVLNAIIDGRIGPVREQVGAVVKKLVEINSVVVMIRAGVRLRSDAQTKRWAEANGTRLPKEGYYIEP